MRWAQKISIVCLLIALSTQLAFCEGDLKSSEEMQKDLEANNRTLQKLQVVEEQNALILCQAEESGKKAKRIYRNLMELTAFGITIRKSIKLQLRLASDIYPAQAAYGSEAVAAGNEVTTNTLLLSMRDMCQGLMSAQYNTESKQISMEIAEQKLTQNEQRLDQGLITDLELMETQCLYEQAKSEYHIAQRQLENLRRSLNSFLGVDLDAKYDVATETIREDKLQYVKHYINAALANRWDIIGIQTQMSLKEKEKGLYQSVFRDGFTRADEDEEKVYGELLKEIEKLQLKRDIAQRKVEREILVAYRDVQDTYNQVHSLWNLIRAQQDQLNEIRVKVNDGLLPRIVLDEVENGLGTLKWQHKMAIYRYNTSRLKLDYAAGIGPGY